ncbi:plectin-like, partial [Limulus polyphemus]|uniref:Plectin-like n=1 Tax=Limulus polyphemus TaxID=6850 RepID=A0ABM1C2B7_LIMPO
PDKFDWRSLRSKTAHEKLDHAFTVAERDFSVTRLLDPEDVDTKDPDEKSLITYISSMYDVFPNPPSYHPFADTDKLRKIDDYKEFASHLHLWIRENISILRDRNFPNTLVEMKSLLSECTRFRNEDVPPKQHEKQKLSHMYRELQKIFRDSGHLDIEPELQSDSLERDWDRLLSTIEERDLAIRDEISRLEKLQRLAEKVHRQTKQCEGRLNEMETKLSEEEKRIQRLEPSEAKHICEELEQELKSIESSIKTLFQDVQTLRDGRYHQAPELHRRVQNLHQRWSNIHVQFTTRIMVTLQKMKKAKPLTEKQLVETNEAFKFLQDCIEWVSSKLKFIEEANFGNDLASVKSLLEQHQTEHRTIDQFQKNVDQCGMRKNQFRGEEYNIYCKMLSRLDRGYSELLVLSNKRLSDLDALLDFIQTATNQLIWMNEKEEIEVSRNWGAKSLNIVEIEQHQENFTNEMELREPQIENIKEQGYNLQRQNHPAVDCIEAYIAALQTQWMWLKNLNRCLNTHLRHASSYHQFFTEARECEKWLNRVEERLNSTFSRQHFSIDEGDRLLRDMLELMNDLNHYGHIVHSLGDRSKEIMPLKQRRQQLSRPLRVTSICSYKQMN